MSIKSISISLYVKDTARADVLLSLSRAYYRFATIDSCEDGEIPFDNAIEIFHKIKLALNTFDSTPMPKDIICNVTLSKNDDSQHEYNNNNISHSTYNSLITILSHINEEFTFIRGFK